MAAVFFRIEVRPDGHQEKDYPKEGDGQVWADETLERDSLDHIDKV